MAVFPRIERHCPYKSQLATMMDGEHCRLCKRDVFDLTAMTDGERTVFLAGCSGEICVSYRLRPAIAAAALAAVALPAAAAAQDAAPAAPDATTAAAQSVEIDEAETTRYVVVIGGIRDPANARHIQVADDPAIPELPVVYEEAPVAPPPAPAPVAEPR